MKVEQQEQPKKPKKWVSVKVERPEKLTVASLATYRADTKPRLISDPQTAGLYLSISARPRGSKSWMMRFRRPNGAMGKIVLGRLDTSKSELKVGTLPVRGQPMTLLGARALAADIHRQRAMGIDVLADYKAQRRRERTAAVDKASNAFATAVRDYAENYVIKKTSERPRSLRETVKLLGLNCPRDGGEPTLIAGGLCERWADKTLREIDGPLVHDLIDGVRKTGIPGLKARKRNSENRARLLFVALSSLFSWLHRERAIDSNPCVSVPKPAPAKKRTRVLTDDELKIFWAACEELGTPFGSIYKICLLTGARLSEAAKMPRSELSKDGTTWNLPEERTKNKKPHIVPLPTQVQQTIADQPPIEGAFVFSHDGKKPVRAGSSVKEQLDKIMERIAGGPITPRIRIHDLRRTAVTNMGNLGIRHDVIELAVNHISGIRGGIAGNYNFSDLLPERKEALQRWADHLEGLVTERSASVIPIDKGRRRGQAEAGHG